MRHLILLFLNDNLMCPIYLMCFFFAFAFESFDKKVPTLLSLSQYITTLHVTCQELVHVYKCNKSLILMRDDESGHAVYAALVCWWMQIFQLITHRDKMLSNAFYCDEFDCTACEFSCGNGNWRINAHKFPASRKIKTEWMAQIKFK